MTTLLKDVITIPERTGADDYVLRLTEGVARDRLAQTLSEYVVTEDLARAFDDALGVVASALEQRESRAAYITGSFGSGKSHFMAVLHALLGNEPAARAQELLVPVVARHDSALQDKKILRLAFHFLDADSVEQCVLGGYVQQIRALHPEAPLPAVHLSDTLIQDAEGFRATMGDDVFLAGLSKGSESAAASPWSAVLGAGWDVARYDAARAAAPDSPERAQLADALVRAYFTSFTRGAEFVDLDTGLAVITEHAKALGYDAVTMFLDELVLWLSFRVRDVEFFGTEAQKITKFVEASNVRALPLITFVARQFDLSRYFDESAGGAGSDKEAIDQAFRHQQGRFATIELGDTNLPFVAQQRLLRPVDAAAKAQIDAAFDRLNASPSTWDVLLDGIGEAGSHRGADRESFRRTYPFSPALVATLRALASAMQRDRTALKVMQQLLVDQRDTLTIEDVIPVGDTFDLVARGDQAITPEMKGLFRNAIELYRGKFHPLLLSKHGLTDSTAASVDRGHPYRAEDRLAKTLILSAIAPEVPALKELTAARLASLNHGSIVTPLPGQEATRVLALVREWSAQIPEIHISSDERNPVIRVRVSEVDFESVVAKAQGEDNRGRREQMVRGMVFEQLGINPEDDLRGIGNVNRVWRGSRRTVEVLFGNVRDNHALPDNAFVPEGDVWRFVIDFPFDDQGKSVRDDDARVDALATTTTAHTVVWLPHHIAPQLRKDLGRLVILDWLLSGPGDRWNDASKHLAPPDRPQARSILENQRDVLRNKLRSVLREAYGVATPGPGNLDVDEGHDRVLRSLHPEFAPRTPVGPDLAAAFDGLVDQALSTSYPQHPRFEPGDVEVRVADLSRVLDAVQRACQERDGLIRVEPGERDSLRRIANPLGLGKMGEDRFQFTADTYQWRRILDPALGRAGIGIEDPVTVGTVRGWLNAGGHIGLRREVSDLVIAAWASLSGRAWFQHGSAIPMPKFGSIDDLIELRPVALPSQEDWKLATTRAAQLFAIAAPSYRTGSSVAELAGALRERATQLRGPAAALVEALNGAGARAGVDGATSGRLATAQACHDLVSRLAHAATDLDTVTLVAAAALPSPEAAGRSLASALDTVNALKSFDFGRLAPLLHAAKAADERATSARKVLDGLRSALVHDEIVEPLPKALRDADNGVFAWLAAGMTAPVTPPSPPAPEPEPQPAPHPHGRLTRTARSASDLSLIEEEMRAFIEEHGPTIIEWRADS